MSGVEIAGFVLAAFPLMISALEHYRKSAEVLEGWWKIKSEYRKCKNNLNYHKVAFEENLEELLLPLIADEEKLQRLLNEPGGPEWKDPDLEKLLMQRMPKTYSSYLDTIGMMMEIVEGLEDALGTNKANFQSRVTKDEQQDSAITGKRAAFAHMTLTSMANIEYQAQRIKLAFNKTTRLELFEEFGVYNSRLRDTLSASDRLAGLRRARVATKTAAINSGLWNFWNHANSVFDLLTDAWSCKCQAFHHANLLLQHRVSSTVNFHVVFWSKSHLDGQLPWAWQDTSIKLIDESCVTLQQPSLPVTPSAPAAHTRPPNLPPPVTVNVKNVEQPQRKSFISIFKKTKSHTLNSKAIKANIPTIVSSSAAASVPNATPPKPKVSFAGAPISSIIEDPLNPRITNLCARIAACSSDLQKYGCLRGETRRYIIQPLRQADSNPQRYLTLEALLGKDRPINLSRRQRYQIALILASSHVQLHPTPWLQSKWSKKNILFLYNENDPNTICIDQPYISQSLAKKIQGNSAVPTGPYTNTHSFQDSIRALGILLLEMCFGTAIEDHKMRRNLHVEDEQSLQLINYAAAIQWSREVVEEAGLEFSDAITWCLHNVPDGGGTEGKEDKWREDMFVKVVEPLKSCHDMLVNA